jgi:2-polyprenyl-6-hydroxyphenyl methylase/3-demethylubiquinone-9 3-methyltransferase
MSGERFAFGANWLRILDEIDETRITRAEAALVEMLGRARLDGLRLLDIGCGSGLSSLAARRLGAQLVSFDYDPQSVDCTAELKRRHCPADAAWRIERGSALDAAYLRQLSRFDIVYSWGVLHHTGDVWQALALAAGCVAPGGLLFVALYNDQGWISHYWHGVKQLYVSQAALRPLIVAAHAPYLFGARWLVRALTGRLALERGMSLWRDMIDWLGGYPFEVATPEAVVAFLRERGFATTTVKTCGRRHGCNEFVFTRAGDRPTTPGTVV